MRAKTFKGFLGNFMFVAQYKTWAALALLSIGFVVGSVFRLWGCE